jgi:hypothetical protein
MNFVLYSVFTVYLAILIIKKAEFVFYIPLFHVLLDVSFFYLGPGSVATYYRGGIIALYIIFIYRFFKFRFPLKNILFIFLIYIGILSFASKEILYSIKGYSQVFLSMMMLPVGYYLINNFTKFNRLNKQFIMIIYVSVFLTAIGYIFDVGKQFNYAEGEQKVGLLGSAGLYTGSVCIALLPMLVGSLKSKGFRVVTYIVAIILFIFILLNMRRTAIMIPFVGVVSFILTTKQKLRYLSYVTAAGLIIIVASIFFGDTLKKRFEFRQEEGRFERDFYKTESRYLEVVKLTESTISFTDPLASVFGMGHNIFAEHIQQKKIIKRMYHTDFAKLLYGSGIVGLLLYLFICAGLIFHSGFYRRESGAFLNQTKSMIFALALINIALMFNGSLNLITLKSALFLYIGALIRMNHLERRALRKKIKTNGSFLPLSQRQSN